jgi:CAAX protease family protein
VLAFVFTWGYFWLVLAPLKLSRTAYVLGGFGPAAAAFIVLACTSGMRGVVALLRSIVRWRVGLRWYVLLLVGLPVLNLLAFLVIPGNFSDFHAPDSQFLLLYLKEIAFSVTLGVAPLWEEVGWRGFALPRLQRLYGPVVGTVILGLLWGVWHLPFFFGPFAQTRPGASFVSRSVALVGFTIGLAGLSIIVTWVLNHCASSTLIAILAHAAFDSSGIALGRLFPSTPPYYDPVHFQTLGIAIVYTVAALVVIVATNGRLGYALNRHKAGASLAPAES